MSDQRKLDEPAAIAWSMAAAALRLLGGPPAISSFRQRPPCRKSVRVILEDSVPTLFELLVESYFELI